MVEQKTDIWQWLEELGSSSAHQQRVEVFLETFGLDDVYRAVSQAGANSDLIDKCALALDYIFATPAGKAAFKGGMQFAVAALQSDHVQLATLSATHMGELARSPDTETAEAQRILLCLLSTMQKAAPTVASACRQAFLGVLRSRPADDLLQGPVHEALSGAVQQEDAVGRLRVIETLAAAEDAGVSIQGILHPLQEQLRNVSDPLAVLATVAMLSEVLQGALQSRQLIFRTVAMDLAQLVSVEDDLLRMGALPLAAEVVAGQMDMEPDGEHVLRLCGAVVESCCSALQPTSAAPLSDELTALNALFNLAQSQTAAAHLLTHAPSLTLWIAQRAVADAQSPQVKLQALWVIAAISGALRTLQATPGSRPSDVSNPPLHVPAPLPNSVSTALKTTLYEAAVRDGIPGQLGTALNEAAALPFPEHQAAAYAILAGIALYTWGVTAILSSEQLLEQLLQGGTADVGEQRGWRLVALLSLRAGLNSVEQVGEVVVLLDKVTEAIGKAKVGHRGDFKYVETSAT